MATAQGIVNSRQKVSDRISHHNLTPTLAVSTHRSALHHDR
jgi:hypothetical protein